MSVFRELLSWILQDSFYVQFVWNQIANRANILKRLTNKEIWEMHFVVLLLSSLLSVCGCDDLLRDRKQEPEGEIAFRSGNAIYVLDLETDSLRKIVEPGYGKIRWSFDGQMIAYTCPSEDYGPSIYQICVIDATGSNKRTVTLMEYQGQILEHVDGGMDPVWSPDGSRIAFSRCLNCEVGGNNYEIFIIELDITAGIKETRISDNPYYDSPSDWSPDGQKILFRSDYSMDKSFDDYGDWYTYNLNDDNKALVLACDSSFTSGSLRYSPDGQFIAFIGEKEKNDIYIANYDGSNIKQITNNNLNEVSLSWSPDGARLVFMAGSPFNGGHIYIIRVDGSDLKKVTDGEAKYFWPEWRPIKDKQ